MIASDPFQLVIEQGLSAFYGDRVSDAESHEVIKAAVDEGCTFIDTSIVRNSALYGPGDNHTLGIRSPDGLQAHYFRFSTHLTIL